MQNSQPLDLEEALARLFEKMPRIGEHTADEAIESIPLDQARGRILARQLSAPISLPPFPCSAMDGYAIRSADLQSHLTHGFSVIGQSLAGHPYAEPVGAGTVRAHLHGCGVTQRVRSGSTTRECGSDGWEYGDVSPAQAHGKLRQSDWPRYRAGGVHCPKPEMF